MTDQPPSSLGSWQVLWTAFVVPASIGLWSAIRWLIERKEKLREDHVDSATRFADGLHAERKALSTDMNAWIDRLQAALDREQIRGDRLQSHCSVLEGLLSETRGCAAEAQQLVQSMQRQIGQEITRFPPLPRLGPTWVLPEDQG